MKPRSFVDLPVLFDCLPPLLFLLHLLLLASALRAHGLLARSLRGARASRARVSLTKAGGAGEAGEEADEKGRVEAAVARLPLVSDLLATHKGQLRDLRLRAEVAALLDARHDDVHLLRYLLSAKGDVSKAATNLCKAIIWRRENASLLEPSNLERVRQQARGWSPSATLPFTTRAGQPVAVAAPFLADLHAKPADFHFLSGIANREESYALCDQMTRASGRLTKLVIIQDLRGFSFGTAMRFSKLQAHFHSSRILHSSLTPLPLRQGNLSKLSEFLYPQLVATVVIAHPPQLIHRLHSLLKVHLPCVLAHLLYELGLLCAAGHLQEAAGQDEACSD
ncbi:MAG: hypothetical protein SGPRY_011814, partial [Prymnesium sp.]